MKKSTESKTETKSDDVKASQRELTAQEREMLHKYVSRLDENTEPKITFSEERRELSLVHPEQYIAFRLFLEQLGTTNRAFANELITALMTASMKELQIDYTKLNAMLNIITSSKPRNEFEAMLAMHAAITHYAIVNAGLQMGAAKTLAQMESMGRLYVKLARTFLDQKEALNRGRAANENTFAVQQTVNVRDGGQAAIVTNVSRNAAPPAGVQRESQVALPRTLSDSSAAPMPIIDNDAGRAGAPVARYRSSKTPPLSIPTEVSKPAPGRVQRNQAG